VKDQETKNRFVELRAMGWSYGRIAQKLKVSKQTLINWSKELSLQIANLRAIEMETLKEEYSLLKSQRIELLGQKLKAIKEELDKRNLAEIPTEKLLNIFLKGHAILERDEIELVFQQETSGLDLLGDLNSVTTWKA
jgi:hypothetical protein